MKDAYINRNSDEDFELRYIDRLSDRFQSILNNYIQIDIFIKHISHNNNSYQIKNKIWNKKHVFKKIINSRAILYLY